MTRRWPVLALAMVVASCSQSHPAYVVGDSLAVGARAYADHRYVGTLERRTYDGSQTRGERSIAGLRVGAVFAFAVLNVSKQAQSITLISVRGDSMTAKTLSGYHPYWDVSFADDHFKIE